MTLQVEFCKNADDSLVELGKGSFGSVGCACLTCLRCMEGGCCPLRLPGLMLPGLLPLKPQCSHIVCAEAAPEAIALSLLMQVYKVNLDHVQPLAA